ncbi:MAG: RNA polymerase sigma factor [Acidobacteria bacterium]|nr:RNA polymerase sigma factor [Acidobacteriota bacterium]
MLIEASRQITPLLRRIAGEASEDVLQGVLWTVARKLTWLNDPGAFKPWIYRIATRAALKHVTRERRVWRVQSHEELDAVAPPERPATPPRADEIPALLAGVTPRSRAVIVLHYLDDLSLDEIAAVLGIPLGTVKSRLSYGLQAMRRVADEQLRVKNACVGARPEVLLPLPAAAGIVCDGLGTWSHIRGPHRRGDDGGGCISGAPEGPRGGREHPSDHGSGLSEGGCWGVGDEADEMAL